MARLLLEADLAKLGLLTWRYDADGVYCFAERAPLGSVVRGRDGRDALERLLRRCKVIR